MDKSKNVIQLSDHFFRIQELDDSPYFEKFLSKLCSVASTRQSPSHLISWWKKNQNRVISTDPVIEYSRFLSSITMTSGPATVPPKPTEPVSTTTSFMDENADRFKANISGLLDQPDKSREISNDLFGSPNFSFGFHFLYMEDASGELKFLSKEYTEVFGCSDPIRTVAKTVGLYCWDKTQPFKMKRHLIAGTQFPIVYRGSKIGKFIADLVDWVVKDVKGENNAKIVFKGVVNCLGKYDGDDKNLLQGRREMLKAALHTPYAVFETFIENYEFYDISEVLSVLNLPFSHNPGSTEFACINETILQSIGIDLDLSRPEGREATEEAESTFRKFISNYKVYKRLHFDSMSLLSIFDHTLLFARNCIEMLRDDVEVFPHLPYLRDRLGADLTILWSLAEYESATFNNGLFADDTGESWLSNRESGEQLTTDISEALFESLIDERQYDAAAAFISSVIFRLCIMNNGMLEAYAPIYSMADRALTLPGVDSTPLQQAIEYASDIADQNSQKITLSHLRKLLAAGDEKGDTKWADLISGGETLTCEFKQTMRRNIRTSRNDKEIEKSVLKTIAGFLNSSGGHLIIGVTDDGVTVGLIQDGFDSIDKFQLHFNNIQRQLSSGHNGHIVVHTPEINGKQIFVVECDKANMEVYLNEEFYIRRGPSTVKLPVPEAVDYIREYFN